MTCQALSARMSPFPPNVPLSTYGREIDCLSLLRAGGLLAIDNVFWSERVADPWEQEGDTLAIRALNEKIHDDSRVDLTMIPIGDGLTLARKRP